MEYSMDNTTEIDELENSDKFKIAIVGHGFVGKAVDFGFEHPHVQKMYIDPKYGTTLQDMVFWEPNLVFVCTPTPMGDDGSVDDSLVVEACRVTLMETKAGIAIKSTIPPDSIDKIIMDYAGSESHKRVVYNPEFLTESSALSDFINPEFHIMGGIPEATQALANLYDQFSNCNPAPFRFMSPAEASFVKYGINSFLATKVTFFNQLFDAVHEYENPYVNFNQIAKAIGGDSRIGHGHTKVPGFDMKRGYGGACFPKDTKAFTKFTKECTLLEKCIIINNDYRAQYELGEREKEQNVKFEEKA